MVFFTGFTLYGGYGSCLNLPTWSVPKTSSPSPPDAATLSPCPPVVVATGPTIVYTPAVTVPDYFYYCLPTFLYTWWHHTTQLHSLLTIMATNPRLAWNLATPPRLYCNSLAQSGSFSVDERGDLLGEPVSQPPCARLIVRHSNAAISQRWGGIRIHASTHSPSSQARGHVTLGDLLEGIYVHFHRPLTLDDHEFFKCKIGLTDAALLRGFNERVSRSNANMEYERLQGYKRIDVLAAIDALDLKDATVCQGSNGLWVLTMHT
jgi:hypothetical protein